jgi:hypothetical protein
MVVSPFSQGEARIARRQAITDALEAKVALYKNPWTSLTVDYGTVR